MFFGKNFIVKKLRVELVDNLLTFNDRVVLRHKPLIYFKRDDLFEH